MPASSTLRDRRRLQTGHEIQSATLRLALREGFEAVTTEMIAAEAGVSLRTFFNYYANKEAALVGRRPEIDPEIIDWFEQASGPLMDDLFEVLSRHLDDGHLSRETIRLISTLLERSPELVPIFQASLRNLAGQIVSLVTSRLGEAARPEAELLAELVSHALGHAIRSWSQSDDMSEAEITGLARQHIENVGKLIGNGNETPSR
ncbi:TetR/AcrR family transcriptional regulator [Paracoccus saliphilus]|uniref:TetR family transcriptional regulator n=1 Tax=Paracoccus saliphilus TaxID=405559 RepID=A0AA46A540_9RHOB|nr:TetR/AcrR family transcriptional regulator [Paracoccus saliphilus]WCR04859.1 TetR family transcriptional regulator [Paracoccus saliphilus]SIS73470.1 transcriptional regulator, TetR family [Paracoccus saliphilus]